MIKKNKLHRTKSILIVLLLFFIAAVPAISVSEDSDKLLEKNINTRPIDSIPLLSFETPEELNDDAFRKITPKEAKRYIDTRYDIKIIDIRDPQEYSRSHMVGAINIPFSKFEYLSYLQNRIPYSKKTGIMIYSKAGENSEYACQLLSKTGFKEVYNLKGGLENWIENGYSTSISKNEDDKTFLKTGKNYFKGDIFQTFGSEINGELIQEIENTKNKILTVNEIIGDRYVHYWEHVVNGILVKNDSILLHTDINSGEIIEYKRNWIDNSRLVLDTLLDVGDISIKPENYYWKKVVIFPEKKDCNYFYTFYDPQVYPVACYEVRFKDGRTKMFDFDGNEIGCGVPAPSEEGFSLAGYCNDDYPDCWKSFRENADSWFYIWCTSTTSISLPTPSAISSYVEDSDVEFFYELAHGGSYYFQANSPGVYYRSSSGSNNVHDDMSERSPMKLAFIGSCEGMDYTGPDSFSYEFRKGEMAGTVTVGYDGMGSCPGWSVALPWQDKLFSCLDEGYTFEEAFDIACADYPTIAPCVKFAGDENLRLKDTLLSINVHEIEGIDPIDYLSTDWYYDISIYDGDQWNVERKWCNSGQDVIVDKTHVCTMHDLNSSIKIKLMEDDFWTGDDLADVSGHIGGGCDDSTPDLRGAIYHCDYDLINNGLSGDMTYFENNYLTTSGEHSPDDSTTVDENDAKIWFKVSDNYELPIADAGSDKNVGVGEIVFFDASNSISSGSILIKFEWDWNNDGIFDETSPDHFANHTWLESGNYTVVLKATDSYNQTDTDTCQVIVDSSKPVAFFTFFPSRPIINQIITFNASLSCDLDGTIILYEWDWNSDGIYDVSNISPVLLHTFNTSGYKDVTLRVIDNDGQNDTYNIIIKILSATFTNNFNDFGLDTDSNNLYDFLVIETEVNVSESREYRLSGQLYHYNESTGWWDWFDCYAYNYTYLEVGIHTILLQFDGYKIYNIEYNGQFKADLDLYTTDDWDWIDDAEYITQSYNYLEFQPPAAQLTGNYNDYGLDTDEDGLYDYLVVEAEVNVTESGEYELSGSLRYYDNSSGWWDWFDCYAYNYTYLEVGIHTILLQFDGYKIYNIEYNGQFKADLDLYTTDDWDWIDDAEYITQSYAYTDFQLPPGQFTENYNDYGLDTDDDGLYDYLVVEAEVNVSEEGDYRLSGDLAYLDYFWWNNFDYDSNSTYLDIGVHTITLRFKGYKIYNLAYNGTFKVDLNLYKKNDGIFWSWNWIDDMDYFTGSYNYTAFERPPAKFTENYNDYGLDTDGDGLYDYLVVEAEVNVAEADEYRLRIDIHNGENFNHIHETYGDWVYLEPSLWWLNVSFDGFILYNYGYNGSFVIDDIWLYGDSTGQIDYSDDPYYTQYYNYDDFERPPIEFTGVFDDYGLDTDDDGLYDYLIIEAEVNVSEASDYRLSADLYYYNESLEYWNWFDYESNYTSLDAGIHDIVLQFEGYKIYNLGYNGQFKANLDLYDTTDWNLMDETDYFTEFYNYAEFEDPPIKFTGIFDDYGLDTDGDGLYDYLIIETEVNVSESGEYELSGNLRYYDNSSDSWESVDYSYNYTYFDVGIHSVTLRFAGYKIYDLGYNGQFKANLDLYDTTDWNLMDEAEYFTKSYNYYDFDMPPIAFTGVFGDYGLDTDGDGLYDYLVVEAEVNVSEEGDYRLSGDLAYLDYFWWNNFDYDSNSTYLDIGVHTITLRYEGYKIYNLGYNGAFKADLDLYTIENWNWIDDMDYFTESYNYTEFERPPIEFTGNFNDYGLDTDQDELYNYLVVEAEVNVTETGDYELSGNLYYFNDDYGFWDYCCDTNNYTQLSEGIQTISLQFDTLWISREIWGIEYNDSFKVNLNLHQEGAYFDDAEYYTNSYNYTSFPPPDITPPTISNLTIPDYVGIDHPGDINVDVYDNNLNQVYMTFSDVDYITFNQSLVIWYYINDSGLDGTYSIRDYLGTYAKLQQGDKSDSITYFILSNCNSSEKIYSYGYFLKNQTSGMIPVFVEFNQSAGTVYNIATYSSSETGKIVLEYIDYMIEDGVSMLYSISMVDDGGMILQNNYTLYSMGNPNNPFLNWCPLENGEYHGMINAMDKVYNSNETDFNLTVYHGQLPNNPPYEPSNPNPENGSTNISIDTTLTWIGGDPDPGDTVTYDIYFGTSIPPPIEIQNHSTNSYNPETLEYNTTYYWKIIAWDNHGNYTEGEIWNFETEMMEEITIMGIIPSSDIIKIGENFTITIYIDPTEPIGGWQIYEFSFTQGIVNAIEITPGAFWENNFDPGDIDNENGTITDIQVWSFGPYPDINHTACIINFTALQPGICTFEIKRVDITNDNFEIIPVITHTAMIDVVVIIPPVVYNEYPENESIGVERPPSELNFTIEDPDDDTMDVYIKWKRHDYYHFDEWITLETYFGVPDGTYNFIPPVDVNDWIWGNTTYTWSVNASDGVSWTNVTFTYTTGGSRYDVNNNDLVNFQDAGLVWVHRTSEVPYDGIYDVNQDGQVNFQDAGLTWINRD